MNNFFVFIIGNISGIYISQNYKIPNVKNLGDKILDYIKSLEKD